MILSNIAVMYFCHQSDYGVTQIVIVIFASSTTLIRGIKSYFRSIDETSIFVNGIVSDFYEKLFHSNGVVSYQPRLNFTTNPMSENHISYHLNNVLDKVHSHSSANEPIAMTFFFFRRIGPKQKFTFKRVKS